MQNAAGCLGGAGSPPTGPGQSPGGGPGGKALEISTILEYPNH